MLQRQVIHRAPLALVLVMAVASCGGDDGGAIEENVVRPGITAMEQASVLACGTDAETLGTAIETYTMLEGAPPVDEAALVASQYIREESELFDVVDGQLVAVAPECGAGAPTITAPSTDVGQIVTSSGPPLTSEQMLAEFSDAEIEEVGGIECARELVVIFSATERYMTDEQAEPETLEQLVDAGYIDTPIVLWQVVGDQLVPAPDSDCNELGA